MLRSSSARRQYTVQQLNCIFHLYISNLIGNLLKEVRALMIISSILYINYFIKIVGSLGQACPGRQCGMFILAIIVAGTLFLYIFYFAASLTIRHDVFHTCSDGIGYRSEARSFLGFPNHLQSRQIST